jgi:uncharacterized protein (UPF0333 family)
MKKRGQAAMEFLMTYGWAILIVLVALGALYYLGLFDSDSKSTGSCSLPAPLLCKDIITDETGVTVKAGLMKGYTANISSMTVNGQPVLT